jgi:hypothetical protein
MKNELLNLIKKLLAFDQQHLDVLLTREPVEKENIELVKKHIQQLHSLMAKIILGEFTPTYEAELFTEISEELANCEKIVNKINMEVKVNAK